MISLSSQNCNHVVCFNPWTKTEGKRLVVGGCCRPPPPPHVSGPRVNIGECRAGVGQSYEGSWGYNCDNVILPAPAPMTGCYLVSESRSNEGGCRSLTIRGSSVYSDVCISVKTSLNVGTQTSLCMM